MKFNFHLANAAANNTPAAKLREQTRMACIAHGLHQLGHDVAICDASVEFRGSTRRPFVAHLFEGHHNHGLEVHAAETMRNREHRMDVAIKTSVGTQNDERFLERCRVLVAHEYDVKFDAHPRLLPVPFLVHDSALEEFISAGLFEAYLLNDVEKIRTHYQTEKRTDRLLGMNACGWRSRKDFCANEPAWADIRFYDTPTMTPGEHIRWLMGFRAALMLPGDTPKSNGPPLLALLGIPIVTVPICVRDTPPMDATNTIQFESWGQVESVLHDNAALKRISERATDAYIYGWSPLGQARLMVERFE